MKKRFVPAAILFTLLLSCTPSTDKGADSKDKQRLKDEATKSAPKPKNIILLIGDGMGLSQVSAAYYFLEDQKPAFSRFPITGLIKTSSATEKITDSAAGAVAFASGVKTYNGAIGKDTLKQNVETMSERMKKQDLGFGLIATSSITHATPACFYAHADLRKQEELIATQLAESGAGFVAAGGIQFFNKRKDQKNLLDDLEKGGYQIDTTALLTETLQPNEKYAFLLAQNGMPSMLEGREGFLPNATKLALEYFALQQNGYFLMIEGSQIDWESHATNAKGVIAEMSDFNKTIHAVLDYAEKDGETLVVVTADHETGGFALSPNWENKNGWNYDAIDPQFYEGARKEGHSSGHTASLIPVFAYGPGAEVFSGVYENTAIFHKMLEQAGW